MYTPIGSVLDEDEDGARIEIGLFHSIGKGREVTVYVTKYHWHEPGERSIGLSLKVAGEVAETMMAAVAAGRRIGRDRR